MSSASATSPFAEAAPLFAALGDPTRLQVLNRLSVQGPASITRLCETAQVSRQAVTKHLDVLARAGLIIGKKQGREHVWQVEPARLADAHAFLDRLSREWDVALERLKRFVEDQP